MYYHREAEKGVENKNTKHYGMLQTFFLKYKPPYYKPHYINIMRFGSSRKGEGRIFYYEFFSVTRMSN